MPSTRGLGGELQVVVGRDGEPVRMTGAVTHVFDGVLAIDK